MISVTSVARRVTRSCITTKQSTWCAACARTSCLKLRNKVLNLNFEVKRYCSAEKIKLMSRDGNFVELIAISRPVRLVFGSNLFARMNNWLNPTLWHPFLCTFTGEKPMPLMKEPLRTERTKCYIHEMQHPLDLPYERFKYHICWLCQTRLKELAKADFQFKHNDRVVTISITSEVQEKEPGPEGGYKVKIQKEVA